MLLNNVLCLRWPRWPVPRCKGRYFPFTLFFLHYLLYFFCVFRLLFHKNLVKTASSASVEVSTFAVASTGGGVPPSSWWRWWRCLHWWPVPRWSPLHICGQICTAHTQGGRAARRRMFFAIISTRLKFIVPMRLVYGQTEVKNKLRTFQIWNVRSYIY